MPALPLSGKRASHPNRLAAAFLLAHKRRDEAAMRSILEDVGDDAMSFCTEVASIAQTMIAQTVGLRLWQEFLEAKLRASTDPATDPTTRRDDRDDT
jgi:hypothetical protein